MGSREFKAFLPLLIFIYLFKLSILLTVAEFFLQPKQAKLHVLPMLFQGMIAHIRYKCVLTFYELHGIKKTKIMSIEELHNFNVDSEGNETVKDFIHLNLIINPKTDMWIPDQIEPNLSLEAEMI